MAILTLKAQHDHLQKISNTRFPIRAISEFVWNAVDADASVVEVIFVRNGLGGIESIIIKDNGNGINKARAERDFESLGASWKKDAPRTLKQRAMHGKEGQGRLKFFSLAQKASWKSVYEDSGKLWQISLDISASALDRCDVSEARPAERYAERGTVVELAPLREVLDVLSGDDARAEINSIFAPYILKYPDIQIIYDGYAIDPRVTIDRICDFPVRKIVCPSRVVAVSLKIIEWKGGIGDRRIHLGAENGIVLGSQPASVTAPDFSFSAYAYTPFFQEIADANLLEIEGLTDPDLSKILEHIRDELGDYFRKRQAERSSGLIDELKRAGLYPYVGDPKDEVERRERDVFDITAQAVSSYSRDFKRADDPIKRMTLKLLREAVRHNPESVNNILHAVFNLPKNRQDEFSKLLNRTALGNIISSSSMIAGRIVELEVLKGMVFDPKHRKHVRERGELDLVVRENTWIFGENFHITLPEAGLTKVMDRVSEELTGNKRNNKKLRKPDGKIGRVDSFLGRVVPQGDGVRREFLLVELKRPSLSVGRKEVGQLEDYVSVVTSQPDYLHTDTFWNFYLVTGTYDDNVKTRITQANRPRGLLDEKENYRVWVKSWGELIRECESRLRFVQERLQIEVSTDEIEQRIADLRAAILKVGENRNRSMGDESDLFHPLNDEIRPEEAAE